MPNGKNMNSQRFFCQHSKHFVKTFFCVQNVCAFVQVMRNDIDSVRTRSEFMSSFVILWLKLQDKIKFIIVHGLVTRVHPIIESKFAGSQKVSSRVEGRSYCILHSSIEISYISLKILNPMNFTIMLIKFKKS